MIRPITIKAFFYFGKGLPYSNIFYGLFPGWTCEIIADRLGNIPASVPGYGKAAPFSCWSFGSNTYISFSKIFFYNQLKKKQHQAY